MNSIIKFYFIAIFMVAAWNILFVGPIELLIPLTMFSSLYLGIMYQAKKRQEWAEENDIDLV